MKGRFSRVLLAGLLLAAATAVAEFRFPMPEFESGYSHPEVRVPAPNLSNGTLDVIVLVGSLALAAWLALGRRSRPGLFALAIGSVLYFGFWRKGCVCSVGSVQNMVNGLADTEFVVPFVVLVFFLAPLIFALFFGRVFCAAVCPLGAVQELVGIRPVQVPRSLEAVLGLIPYVYLGLAVLSVTMGSGFLICRYDPFVGFFRHGASFNMFLVGGVFLIGGIFIARPYCRFLCPYGVLLGWMSRFSRWHASVTPRNCVQCRLCEEACPYNAIDAPTPVHPPEARRRGVRRLALLLFATPLITGFGVWAGVMTHEVLARLHPTVQLAERIALEERGEAADTTVESDAFRAGRQTVPQLYAEADALRARFRHGSGWLGAFLGVVVACKLVGLSVVRRRTDYETNRGNCFSCGRCFAYCPVEKEVPHA